MKRLFFLAFVLASCTPSGLRVSTAPSATLQVGGLTRAVDAIHDLGLADDGIDRSRVQMRLVPQFLG